MMTSTTAFRGVCLDGPFQGRRMESHQNRFDIMIIKRGSPVANGTDAKNPTYRAGEYVWAGNKTWVWEPTPE